MQKGSHWHGRERRGIEETRSVEKDGFEGSFNRVRAADFDDQHGQRPNLDPNQ